MPDKSLDCVVEHRALRAAKELLLQRIDDPTDSQIEQAYNDVAALEPKAFYWGAVSDRIEMPVVFLELSEEVLDRIRKEMRSKLKTLPTAEAKLPDTATQIAAEIPDKCTAGLAYVYKAHQDKRRLTVTELAEQLNESRPALYENIEYATLREAANKLFGLFERKAGKGDWEGPTQDDV